MRVPWDTGSCGVVPLIQGPPPLASIVHGMGWWCAIVVVAGVGLMGSAGQGPKESKADQTARKARLVIGVVLVIVGLCMWEYYCLRSLWNSEPCPPPY